MTAQAIPENSVLLMQFRQFTSELIRRKHGLELQFPPGAGGGSADDPDAGAPGGLDAETAQTRGVLLDLMSQQAARTQEIGGTQSYGIYREAEYVMAVLADELMLNGDWAGRYRWRLLEDELFGTHAAGEIFFQRLDRLLAPAALPSRELAMIYLQALALDFRGRFRGFDPQKQLDRYRRQIFARVYGHSPEQEARGRLFPQSYEHEVEDEARRLGSAHRWWWALAGVLGAWVVLSSLLWLRIADPVHGQAQRMHALPGGRAAKVMR